MITVNITIIANIANDTSAAEDTGHAKNVRTVNYAHAAGVTGAAEDTSPAMEAVAAENIRLMKTAGIAETAGAAADADVAETADITTVVIHQGIV